MLAARAALLPVMRAVLLVMIGATMASSLAAADGHDSLPLSGGGSTPVLRLSDGRVSIAVAPELGGKIISLTGSDGHERLSRSGKPYVARTAGMAYGDTEFDGIDEIFPTLGVCAANTQHPALPDHGEVCRLAWRVVDGPGISLAVDGVLQPYRLTRAITIEPDAADPAGEPSIVLSYTVANLGQADLPYVYCFHPLFAMDSDLDLELRPEQSLRVLLSSDGFLGANDRVERWDALLSGPLGGHAGKPGRNRFWKAVVQKVADARIGLHWGDGGSCAMSWSGDVLPHCAIWATEGGILDGLRHLAPEPSVASVDGLDDAIVAGEARTLKPGAIDRWTIRLRLAPKPADTKR